MKQARAWEEIFATYTTNKSVAFVIHKELPQIFISPVNNRTVPRALGMLFRSHSVPLKYYPHFMGRGNELRVVK